MLVQPHVDLESLECMAEGELEAAVTMHTEAGEVLEATGTHPQPPPHHQAEDVDMAVDEDEDVDVDVDEVDVCPQLYQGAEPGIPSMAP